MRWLGSIPLWGVFVSVAIAGTAPRVVKTSPPDGAKDVDPATTEIVVVFDMPVKQNSWSVVQAGDETFPELAGDSPISFRDDKTCVVKVKLQADTAYGLGINSKTRQGFKSAADETAAEPHTLRFRTGSGKPVKAEGPRVVRTDPVNGAADLEAGTYDLTIVFSEPMKDGQASIMTPPEGPRLKMIGEPKWRDARTFVVPIVLAAKTTYRVGINTGESKKFVTASGGTPAAAMEFTFSTVGVPSTLTGTDKAVQLRYDCRQGDAGRLMQKSAVDIKLTLSTGQTIPMSQKSGMNSIEEVLVAEKGYPVEVRKIVSEYVMQATDPESGQMRSSPRLEKPVTVKLDRRKEPVKVEALNGEVPPALMNMLAEDSLIDILPARAMRVGQTAEPSREALAKLKSAFDVKGEGSMDLRLTCKRIGTMEVPDARNAMFKAQGGGEPVTYEFDVAVLAIDWKQDGVMQNDIPFSMTAKGELVFAIDAGVVIRVKVDGEIDIKSMQTQGVDGQAVTLSGGGTYSTDRTFEPIKWTRGVRKKPGRTEEAEDRAPPVKSDAGGAAVDAAPGEKETLPGKLHDGGTKRASDAAERSSRETTPPPGGKLPRDWKMMNDELFGSQVAVPPGWTPRVRGDVALCIEPDEITKAGAFFVPMVLKAKGRPEDLADGFDEMLRKAIPTLRTETTGKPATDCVQRDLSGQIGRTPISGSYRAVVGRTGTGFVMGFLTPDEQLGDLKPTFYRILGSYRYTGSRVRLQPYRSAAIELRIPQGWQVRTSEANGTANQDIDWEAVCPSVPSARAFMVSPKFFSSNWITDALSGQIDQQLLPLWQNKGFTLANFTSDEQAIRQAMTLALPGLQVTRQQSLDEIRDLFSKIFELPIQTVQTVGGRMTIHAYEFIGRREVRGREMRCVATIGMGALIVQAPLRGPAGIWMTGIRGYEAPAERFADLSPMLERVGSSFTYTMWWIREVMKANEAQANTLRRFYADMNRLDKEIFDNRVSTNSAINEMMYDTLTENHGYVNEKTGSIEKIAPDQVDRFRLDNGDIVSPDEVINQHVDPRNATRIRAAGADDYMSFDRRVQVWP